MTLSSAVFLVAAAVWLLLPMKTEGTSSNWKKPEYLLALAMFGFGGVGMLLGLTTVLPSSTLLLLRFGPLVAGGAVIAFANILNGAVVRPAGLLLLGFFTPMGAFAIAEQAYIMPLMSLAIMAPAIIVPRNGYSVEPLYTGLRDAIRFTVASLAVLMLVVPGQIVGPCRGDKCSIWGLAIGPLGTGNAFGIYLAFVAGLTVFLSRNTLTAVLATVVSGALVDATSSRSALFAWTISVLAAHVWRLARQRKRLALTVVCVVTAGLMVTIATYAWRPEDFTGRANLWIVARELFLSNPFFGYGPSFWVRQERTSYVDSNYATHNLVWEVLISAGIVGAAVLVLAILCLIRSSHWSLQGSTLVLVAAWMAGSTLEVTAAPARFYLLPGVLLLIFIHGQSQLRSKDSGPASVERRSGHDSHRPLQHFANPPENCPIKNSETLDPNTWPRRSSILRR